MGLSTILELNQHLIQQVKNGRFQFNAKRSTCKLSQTLKLRETIFPNVSLEMKSGSLLPMDPISLEHIQLVQQFQLHTIFLTTLTCLPGSPVEVQTTPEYISASQLLSAN